MKLPFGILGAAGLATVAAGLWLEGSGESVGSGPEPCLPVASGHADEVRVPGGTFRFGADDAYPEEGPAHETTVDGFWMDRHEVTNGQFARFVEDTGYVTVAERSPDPADYPDISSEMLVPGSAVFSQAGNESAGWQFVADANWRQPRGPESSIEGMEELPVVHIAYEDARAYANWAGRDLPSEAEWEFAARGGRATADENNGPTADVRPDGRYRGNTWQGSFPIANEQKDGYAGLAPVERFPENGYGLFDMTGNVWEWTSSWYSPGHRKAGDAGAGDPRQPGVPVRVIKGGSYLCARNFCWRYRPSARQPQDVAFSSGHIGFRTVRRDERIADRAENDAAASCSTR